MHTEYPPTPGTELRRRRLALGAQQKDVASKLNLDRITVYRIERNPEVPWLVARDYLAALAKIAATA
jgi:transcriptional regulator with XRE-family HTH domain